MLCVLHPYCHNKATRYIWDSNKNITATVCEYHYKYPPPGFIYGFTTGSTMPRYNNRSRGTATAQLIYEPALQGYSLKFSYNQTIIDFIKKLIPSHKRTTSGPPDWVWYFGVEYFDIIRLLFDGHREYKVTIVTKEEVEAMQAAQQETRSSYTPTEFSIGAELQKFRDLLVSTGIVIDNGIPAMKQIENWTRAEALKVYRQAAMLLHPDKGGDPNKMSELNSTWSLLKEGYYIK